ncbi:type VI secretion system-associated protein TagO [Acidimangrovimonas pyrenivorans]|uniref:Type VI secretion system-associated protein TagO n=1 Tax=Acidimangrovimonas pyrenivorans TaxID=2030798 RepID=A0ABV7ALL6_9RHOB
MKYSRTAFLVACILAAAPGHADPRDCAKIANDTVRLACYDAIFGKPKDGTEDKSVSAPSSDTDPAADAGDTGKWQMRTDTSKMTDQKSVFLSLESENDVPGRFGGGGGPATLVLRCMENTTALLFSMNNQFMADIQGYGRVEYRIDDQKMGRVNMNESTDNSMLGLWSGGRSIPFIKKLMGHDRLVLRATPYNENTYTVSFDIKGLDNAIGELRQTCHW